jgi:NAD(P)-dependent dehydrogenase (short-subunit alcohol dehydrogenase family)
LDKAICITGTNRGLGLELTQQMLKLGYTVYAGWHHTLSEELKNCALQFPGNLYPVEMDIGDDQSVQKAARYISSLTETLDMVINNGAILGDIESTLQDEIDFSEIQQVFNVNALGALRVSKALLPLILKGNTKLIVNISSEAGSIGDCTRKGWFAYCMSKAALNMESALIHNFLQDLGGQVLVIHPGWMKTFMRGHVDEEAPYSPGESAIKIVNQILDHQKYRADQPAFIDFEGKQLPW